MGRPEFLLQLAAVGADRNWVRTPAPEEWLGDRQGPDAHVARNKQRPGRTHAILGGVIAILMGLVALGGVWEPKLGLDLQGGTRIALQASTEGDEDPTAEQLDQAQAIIAQRVNGQGVSAAEVSTRGDRQILVEIPGDTRSDIVPVVGRTLRSPLRHLT